jgi:hypothetical protein
MSKIIQASIVIATFSLLAMAQSSGQDPSRTAVIVPPDVALAVVVSQPDSPLKIEEAEILRYFSGGYGPSYRLRNAGRKTIVAYTIAKWSSGVVIIQVALLIGMRPIVSGRYRRERSIESRAMFG